ncbi:MAG: hypothetical protein ACK559_02525, partial [bacterium]
MDRGDAVLDPAQHTQTTQLPLLTSASFFFFCLFCLRNFALVFGLSFVKIITRMQLFIDFKLLYCERFLPV